MSAQANWLGLQAHNTLRHQQALRSFCEGEFGRGDTAPSQAHLQAVNTLLARLRASLEKGTGALNEATAWAQKRPTPESVSKVLALKEAGQGAVMSLEKVWDFYFELFGQRQSRFAPWLLSCDRIGRDCYQAAFVRVGVARSLPLPPFSYVRTGFSPATFTRGKRLSKLGLQLNPFPLVQLPYHRLVNPWTLGAILHEVSHNLQNDLGLHEAIPKALEQRLTAARVPALATQTWVRWNRETFADLSGLLLGGPSVVGSLMDVVGRSYTSTTRFQPRGVHPTPYVRLFLSIELLRRLGFASEAKGYERLWRSLYPSGETALPTVLRRKLSETIALVVDTICFQPYPALGSLRYADVVPFAPRHQVLIEEGASRLARGIDPGILPARFLIGAARVACERNLARPETIQKNFYAELTRR
jgi:hypothetical protein